jgi:RNA polymerase sigma-70 factor (ECF subfamily)
MQTKTDIERGLNPSKWLDCHGDYLYRYALMRVREAAMAEDLLQDTLLAAVRSYQTHEGRSSERTWLVGIMKHKVIDYFRRSARNAQFQLTPQDENDEGEWFENAGPWRGHWREDRAPTDWHRDAGQCLESEEFWQIFKHCLSQLPPQMSIAFTLREMDGLSSTEICEILNVTPNNLWVLLHRGRNQLRHLLEVKWFQERTPSPPVKPKFRKPITAETTAESHLSYQSAAA